MMKPLNELKLTVPAIRGNEAFIRSAVAAFCVSLEPSLETINDIKTAVSEAVTNVIVHAYDKPEDNYIYTEAELSKDGLSIIIRDTGRGIADIAEAMRPSYTSKPEKERSGLGFTFMQTFMDSLEVESRLNKGTVIKMKKLIKKAEENGKNIDMIGEEAIKSYINRAEE